MAFDSLILLCKAHRLPEPEREVRFAPPRRWRFDYAWRQARVAVEIDGGVWTRGRHTRGAGFLKDCEKLNHASLDGWRVFRFTPKQITAGDCLPILQSALARFWENRPWPNERT